MPRKKPVREDGSLVLVSDLEEDRAYQAIQLRNQGYDWTQVANQTGYQDATTARMSARAYTQRASLQLTRERREEIVETQIARLDDLYQLAYARAAGGDLKAIDTCVRIAGQTARIVEQRDEGEDRLNTKTVVVTSEEYASVLQAHVEARQA